MKRAQPEYLLSCAVADYLAVLEKTGRIVDYFHVPNGGQRHAAVASKLKRMGVRAGVPDFVIRGKVGGRVCFMELKIGKGRESPAQVEFRTRGTTAGHVHFICRDLDDVKRAIDTFTRNTEILFGGFKETG